MTPDITHDVSRHRFETTVDGEHCALDYETLRDTMTITHVVVPEPVSRRGIAAALMQAALGYARKQGWHVVPSCPYAAYFVEKNPEWSGLVAKE
ncbi:MAG TPA: GNAT family N-acetyltransferase [Rhodanobacteraceae bacterium]|jgi:predicted GNAT family acetyltransferase|nr:GNAT family N-acetyltransferase [Rhodanobacteraceae bacterium]